MQKRRTNILTLIPYRFLPISSGGHLAHLYFHNYISEYTNSIVIGSAANNETQSVETLKFRLLKVFKNKYLTYSQIFYLPKILKIINQDPIDIILCSHPYLGFLGYILSKIKNIPLVVYSHNIESDRFRNLGKWWWKILFYYEKWIMSRSEMTFFVTNEDRIWAIKNYGLSEIKCIVSPFGINLSEKPIKERKYREGLCQRLGINYEAKILYFAGSYNYYPNDEAVEFILNEIYPRLSQIRDDFAILIIGKGLNQELKSRIDSLNGKIIYLGFVENIHEILYSADLMLNPMLSGGGIKTKAVEALGNNIKVVSTENGSFGLDSEACEGMLWISKDKDWDSFVKNIDLAIESNAQIENRFYLHYSWQHVTKKVAESLSTISF